MGLIFSKGCLIPNSTAPIDLRPCEVDGDKAYFHRWALDEHTRYLALIEYLDGSVSLVHPERVRFLDR